MGAETAFLSALKNIDRFRQSRNTLELLKGRRVVIRFSATPASRLEDKKWVLDSIGSTSVSKIGRTAFLVFDKTKASAGGNSSCNVFGGTYSATGSTLKITEVISTMRACIEDERMEIERQFLDALRETNRYQVRNNKLMLYKDDRLLLTMTGEAK
jgi:heat shock protein HslJ